MVGKYYENWMPSTNDGDFTVATLVVVGVVLLLLCPLTSCARERKRRRRARKAAKRAQSQAQGSPENPYVLFNPEEGGMFASEADLQSFIDDLSRLVPEGNTHTVSVPVMSEDDESVSSVSIQVPSWYMTKQSDGLMYRYHQTKAAINVFGGSADYVDGDDDSVYGNDTVRAVKNFLNEDPECYLMLKMKDLPKKAKKAAISLGYTEKTWLNPAQDTPEKTYAYNKDWNALTEFEKKQAAILGYDERSWQDGETVKSSAESSEAPIKGQTCRILFSCDKEARRIFRIAVPSTIGSATSTLTSAMSSALISYNFGADNFIAYSMVFVLTGLADALYGGIGAAAGILVAQAIGAGNKYLAAQYEQAAFLLEYLFAIPLYAIVWFYYEEIIEFMGLDEEIAQLGRLYLPFQFMAYPIADLTSVISDLMWAEERGGTMTFIDNLYNITYLGLLIGLIFGEVVEANLVTLGCLDLLASFIYFLMVWAWVECKGWLSPYRKGLLRSLSVRNWKLVKSIVTMSFPLTIGGIVSTCEWELLTIFAAHMGGSEVAAWTILGSIWGIFEYFPTGFTTAAELRVSRHLGNRRPGMAKIAAYKSMIYSIVSTAIITFCFCYYRYELIGLYTNEDEIEEMLNDLVLLVGIANMVMVIGVMAYTILCAQNRTNLATGTYAFLSFATTLPMSVYFVFFGDYGLQSIVFSLIVGYSLSSLILVVFLLTTNWRRCSEAVVRKAAKTQEEQARLSRAKEKKRRAKEAQKDIESRFKFVTIP